MYRNHRFGSRRSSLLRTKNVTWNFYFLRCNAHVSLLLSPTPQQRTFSHGWQHPRYERRRIRWVQNTNGRWSMQFGLSSSPTLRLQIARQRQMYFERQRNNQVKNLKKTIIMHRKSRFLVALAIAAITFGTLWLTLGSDQFNRGHRLCEHEHCCTQSQVDCPKK